MITVHLKNGMKLGDISLTGGFIFNGRFHVRVEEAGDHYSRVVEVGSRQLPWQLANTTVVFRPELIEVTQ